MPEKHEKYDLNVEFCTIIIQPRRILLSAFGILLPVIRGSALIVDIVNALGWFIYPFFQNHILNEIAKCQHSFNFLARLVQCQTFWFYTFFWYYVLAY